MGLDGPLTLALSRGGRGNKWGLDGPLTLALSRGGRGDRARRG